MLNELALGECEDVEFDDSGQLDQWFDAGTEHEIVERQRVTISDERSGHVDDLGVDLDVLEDFQDHPIGGKALAVAVGEERVGDVHEGAMRTDELVEADVAERGQEHLRRRRVGVAELYTAIRHRAEQQLIRYEPQTRVVDPLARYHCGPGGRGAVVTDRRDRHRGAPTRAIPR